MAAGSRLAAQAIRKEGGITRALSRKLQREQHLDPNGALSRRRLDRLGRLNEPSRPAP